MKKPFSLCEVIATGQFMEIKSKLSHVINNNNNPIVKSIVLKVKCRN